jgi:hypothetical protein
MVFKKLNDSENGGMLKRNKNKKKTSSNEPMPCFLVAPNQLEASSFWSFNH